MAWVARLLAPTLESRLTLAFIAGLAWWPLVQLGAFLGGEMTPLPLVNESDHRLSAIVGWSLIWSTGAVYAALVLLPLLDEKKTLIRCAVLLFAGAFSYWMGVNFSSGEAISGIQPMVLRVAIAGSAAALFLGIVTAAVGQRRVSAMSWMRMALAGAAGGAMIGFAVDYLDDNNGWAWLPGHLLWEMLTCAVFWFGWTRRA